LLVSTPKRIIWRLIRCDGPWKGGDPAEGPAPASSFEALDAMLAKLADRRLFPNLDHGLWEVPGVGYDGDKMLTSPWGLKARFDVPGCRAAP